MRMNLIYTYAEPVMYSAPVLEHAESRNVMPLSHEKMISKMLVVFIFDCNTNDII